MASHTTVEYAMFVATAASIVVAAAGAVLAFAAWVRVSRRVGLPLLSGFFSVLALGVVYVVSAIVLMAVVHYQLDPRVAGDFSLGITFIHPGLLHKVAPLAAIIVTWLFLLRRRHRRLPTASQLGAGADFGPPRC
jgi:hypothetical protein